MSQDSLVDQILQDVEFSHKPPFIKFQEFLYSLTIEEAQDLLRNHNQVFAEIELYVLRGD